MGTVQPPGPNEIHLWQIDLDLPASRVDELRSCLSADERARAGRLRMIGKEAHAVAGRGSLRRLLAGYLDGDASAISLVRAEGGKPSLHPHRLLRYSFSDSGSRALVAVARAREVGVDIECHRHRELRPALIERVMSPAERAAAERCHPREALALFYRLWARKEAVLKAAGVGLRMRPARVHVLETDVHIGLPTDEGEERGWRLRDVDVGEGWAAAVAWEAAP